MVRILRNKSLTLSGLELNIKKCLCALQSISNASIENDAWHKIIKRLFSYKEKILFIYFFLGSKGIGVKRIVIL